MSWFKRKSPADKYPPDRLARLPFELCVRVRGAADQLGVPFDDLSTSKFVTGYLSGYASYIEDNAGPAAELAIRFMIFASIYGQQKGRELATAAVRNYEAGDRQTRMGFGAGAADGTRYFSALENGVDAKGMSDSFIDFQKMMKVNEQTL